MEKLNVNKILGTPGIMYELFKQAPYENEKLEKLISRSMFDPGNTYFLCIIAGCSGSGKSYFEKMLVENYPDYFNKLPQVTTRKRREKDEKGYYFINNEIYNYMEDSLIARLGSFNGNQYGTIPVFEKDKINTVIAAHDAIEDLFNLIDNGKLTIAPIMILFDITDKNISSDGKRNDRDSSFLEKERKELFNVFEKYKGQCVFSKIYRYEDYGRFAELSDIIEI